MRVVRRRIKSVTLGGAEVLTQKVIGSLASA